MGGPVLQVLTYGVLTFCLQSIMMMGNLQRMVEMEENNDKRSKISRKKFLNLSTREIQRLVIQKNKPRTGIFLADGNRRLVMTLTGLTPGTDADGFYHEYLKIVTRYFRENLKVFFDYGLNTLFFPLFGPSLLERERAYRELVIPELTDVLFKSETWFNFYKKYDIRIKPYGNVKRLDLEFPGLDLAGKVMQMAALTSRHQAHTLYFGFFSTTWLGIEMIQQVNNFMKSHGCEPGRKQMIELYYGEDVPPADFFINSTRNAGLGALPPLISGKETKIYTMVSPGILALNRETFRNILYDLLFCREPTKAKEPESSEYTPDEDFSRELEALKDFYRLHQQTVIGQGKRIGKFWVLDV